MDKQTQDYVRGLEGLLEHALQMVERVRADDPEKPVLNAWCGAVRASIHGPRPSEPGAARGCAAARVDRERP